MRKRFLNLIIGGAVIIVAILAAFFVLRGRGYFSGVMRDTGAGLSDYTAVFVNGGGIYFGKVTSDSNGTFTLEDVFSYGVVNAAGATSTSTNAEDQKPTLFDASKVGIAPATRYHINRDQVILYYTLKKESEVVKTIEKYKANPNAATATPTPSPAGR
jgi:hypothetical protein